MRCTNCATGLAIAFRRTALLSTFLALTASYCSPKPPANHRQAWSISIGFGPILEGVSRKGLLLLNEIGGYVPPRSWNVQDPKLLLRTPSGVELPIEISLPKWPQYEYELPEGVAGLPAGPFKFIGAGDYIVGIQGPWLLLIDVPSAKEIRRVLALKDLGDFEQPKRPIPVFKNPVRGKLINTSKVEMVAQIPFPPLLAVSPEGDRVAVAYNGPAKHWIFIYSSNLTRRLAGWNTPNRIQDMCWSKDGKLLAVLYHNPTPYNTDRHRDSGLARFADVSIFDTSTWKVRLAFAGGDYDAKAAFSPDARLLYVISGWYSRVRNIRAFSALTGKLAGTIRVKGTGVRGNLAVSPDGRLIAAESTTSVGFPYIFDQPEEYLDVNAGFVILNAATGQVVFRVKRRTPDFGSLPLFFSADGRTLVVNFATSSKRGTGREIVGYSLVGLVH